MARAKKSRKGGLIGTPKESFESRGKKKPVAPPRNKRKSGNAAGTRQNVDSGPGLADTGSANKDKRIGSKKPIPLVVEKARKQSDPVKRRKFATPEKELDALEADQRFNRLLDKLEDEQVLSKEDKTWLDQQLARHKVLCDLLGIKEETGLPEDDPFSQLDAIQLDDFKD